MGTAARDMIDRIRYNRELKKGNRERHIKIKKNLYKGIPGEKNPGDSKQRPIDQKGVQAVNRRLRRSRIFEKWAFAMMALMLAAFVLWVIWG